MDDDHATHEEIKGHLRNGRMLDFNTPGLEAAARELIRPFIEQMRGILEKPLAKD